PPSTPWSGCATRHTRARCRWSSTWRCSRGPACPSPARPSTASKVSWTVCSRARSRGRATPTASARCSAPRWPTTRSASRPGAWASRSTTASPSPSWPRAAPDVEILLGAIVLAAVLLIGLGRSRRGGRGLRVYNERVSALDLRLAPMAGVSNAPFRLVARECGAGRLTSEEIDARALVHDNARTLALAAYLPEERPLAMQLLGEDP